MKRQTSGFKNMLSCFGPPPELMMHRWLQISCNCVALLTTCSWHVICSYQCWGWNAKAFNYWKLHVQRPLEVLQVSLPFDWLCPGIPYLRAFNNLSQNQRGPFAAEALGSVTPQLKQCQSVKPLFNQLNQKSPFMNFCLGSCALSWYLLCDADVFRHRSRPGLEIGQINL